MSSIKERNTLPRGDVRIILRDREGNEVRKVEAKNMIVSGGRVLVANLFRGIEKRGVSHMGLGSGKKGVEPGDTDLASEVRPRRPFDMNELQEERTAWCALQDAKGKECARAVSLERGSSGNAIRLKVKKEKKGSVTLFVEMGERHEVFERIGSLKEVTSELISFENVKAALPAETDWTNLHDGSDTVVTLSSTFGYQDCNGKISEAGLFNAEDGGIMYNRVVFPEIVKTSDLTLTMVWKVTF